MVMPAKKIWIGALLLLPTGESSAAPGPAYRTTWKLSTTAGGMETTYPPNAKAPVVLPIQLSRSWTCAVAPVSLLADGSEVGGFKCDRLVPSGDSWEFLTVQAK